MNYPGLDFTQAELRAAMASYYDDLLEFVSTDEFRSLYRTLMALPPSERPTFVETVILSSKELEDRGIRVPEDILVQTSAFGDRRPTLFAVKKFLPEKFHRAWENVNITFFNDFDDETVPNDPENAWRLPLPVALQQALLANGIDLNSVSNDIGMTLNR
ncbi:hypothetical protein [Rhizobium sp. MHM7A]|uniref:hypothetical protein n=1 Tax=Rhizobium sp. MHM7A TaxID=2583233 RepID=UPI0011065675|nr:hypothetical protein [Rhizobium sp. MHM7A]TLX05682.1 hypothetical protein FFR93_33900 [Rhizobium sp. MHM7A]